MWQQVLPAQLGLRQAPAVPLLALQAPQQALQQGLHRVTVQLPLLVFLLVPLLVHQLEQEQQERWKQWERQLEQLPVQRKVRRRGRGPPRVLPPLEPEPVLALEPGLGSWKVQSAPTEPLGPAAPGLSQAATPAPIALSEVPGHPHSCLTIAPWHQPWCQGLQGGSQ